MLRPSPLALDQPLWLCAFRPFFLAAALSAALLVALWGCFLGFGLPLPPVAGGPFVWHAHELLFGFALAAVAGFALTAVPEFTGTAAVTARPVRRLFALWLAARAAFWASGWLGTPALVVAGLAHLALVVGLMLLLAPRLFADPERKHLAFLWSPIALALLMAGFYVDAIAGNAPARWLHATIGLLMALIVVAMSRISMRIVNAALEERDSSADYRARPPKRNLAIVCIAAYTVAEFVAPGGRVSGWLALAAAAALCHLQSDWHVGRALLRRWPLMLFSVYVLMAAGYALMGIALVAGVGSLSTGRHLLTVGAIGLSIYAVLNIAGRMHCGLPLDERRWVPAGAAALFAAAVLRAATALPAAPVNLLFAGSALLWTASFAAWLWHMAPLLSAPRSDGAAGCAGPADAAHE